MNIDPQLMQLLLKAGIAAFLPGMRYMHQRQKEQLDQLGELLEQLENDGAGLLMPPKKRRGRPPRAILEALAIEAGANGREVKLLEAATAPAPAAAPKNGRRYTQEQLAGKLKVSRTALQKLLMRLGIKRVGNIGKFAVYSGDTFARLKEHVGTKKDGIGGYWYKMTPEERRAEMHRRIKNGLGKKRTATA